MSSNIVEDFASLVALTQLYLLQEHTIHERLPADLESFLFFKRFTTNHPLSLLTKQTQKPEQPLPKNSEIPVEKIATPVSVEVIPTHQKTSIANPLSSQKQVVKATPPAPEKFSITTQNMTQITKKESIVAPATPDIQEIALEPMGEPPLSDFSSIKTSIIKLFPQYPINNTIPSDGEAKSLGISVKDVIIFTMNPSTEEELLLLRLCDAIQTRLAPATLVKHIHIPPEGLHNISLWDKFLQTSPLRLILITHTHLKELPHLQKSYRLVDHKTYLGRIPLLIMEEPSLYVKEPQRKAALWKNICSCIELKTQLVP